MTPLPGEIQGCFSQSQRMKMHNFDTKPWFGAPKWDSFHVIQHNLGHLGAILRWQYLMKTLNSQKCELQEMLLSSVSQAIDVIIWGH